MKEKWRQAYWKEYRITKWGYVLAYLQGITADEAADDAFCERMYESYRNDPDPEKDVTYLRGVQKGMGA
mgnify:CR=1 FL=1